MTDGLTANLQMALNKVQDKAYKHSVGHGFWDKESSNIGLKLALIHSEVSEVLEAERKPEQLKSDKIPMFYETEEEAADVFIRLVDLCRHKKWRLAQAVVAKMNYNETRPYKHGKKY